MFDNIKIEKDLPCLQIRDPIYGLRKKETATELVHDVIKEYRDRRRRGEDLERQYFILYLVDQGSEASVYLFNNWLANHHPMVFASLSIIRR